MAKKKAQDIAKQIASGIENGVKSGIQEGMQGINANANNANPSDPSTEKNAAHGAEARKKSNSETQERANTRNEVLAAKSIENLSDTIKDSSSKTNAAMKKATDFIAESLKNQNNGIKDELNKSRLELKDSLSKNYSLTEKIKEILTEDSKREEDRDTDEKLDDVLETLSKIFTSIDEGNRNINEKLLRKIIEVNEKKDKSADTSKILTSLEGISLSIKKLQNSVDNIKINPIESPTNVSVGKNLSTDNIEIKKELSDLSKTVLAIISKNKEKQTNQIQPVSKGSYDINKEFGEELRKNFGDFTRSYKNSIDSFSNGLKNFFSLFRTAKAEAGGASVSGEFLKDTSQNVIQRGIPLRSNNEPVNVKIVSGLENLAKGINILNTNDIITSDSELSNTAEGRSADRIIRYFQRDGFGRNIEKPGGNANGGLLDTVGDIAKFKIAEKVFGKVGSKFVASKMGQFILPKAATFAKFAGPIGLALGASSIIAGFGLMKEKEYKAETNKLRAAGREKDANTIDNSRKVGSVLGTVGGTAAGVGLGALAGAKGGAMLGAFAGPVGMAVGGILGAGLGYLGGKIGGQWFGRSKVENKENSNFTESGKALAGKARETHGGGSEKIRLLQEAREKANKKIELEKREKPQEIVKPVELPKIEPAIIPEIQDKQQTPEKKESLFNDNILKMGAAFGPLGLAAAGIIGIANKNLNKPEIKEKVSEKTGQLSDYIKESIKKTEEQKTSSIQNPYLTGATASLAGGSGRGIPYEVWSKDLAKDMKKGMKEASKETSIESYEDKPGILANIGMNIGSRVGSIFKGIFGKDTEYTIPNIPLQPTDQSYPDSRNILKTSDEILHSILDSQYMKYEKLLKDIRDGNVGGSAEGGGTPTGDSSTYPPSSQSQSSTSPSRGTESSYSYRPVTGDTDLSVTDVGTAQVNGRGRTVVSAFNVNARDSGREAQYNANLNSIMGKDEKQALTDLFVKGGKITGGVGDRSSLGGGASKDHQGVDIALRAGADITSPMAGKVLRSGKANGYGNMVEIDHGNGMTTLYAHLADDMMAQMREGTEIAAGQVIGKMGNTGTSVGKNGGYHLHTEMKKDGQIIDPLLGMRSILSEQNRQLAESSNFELGELSSKYEGNVGTVNWKNYQNDKGGLSFGKYQFASKVGGLQSFMGQLQQSNPEYYNQLMSNGASMGGKGENANEQFARNWEALAKADPKGFEAAQDAVAKKNWYDPKAKKFQEMTGIDPNTNPAIANAVWSASIQHGNFGKLIGESGIQAGMSDEEVINRLYDRRSEYTDGKYDRRYESERKDALAMNKEFMLAKNKSSTDQMIASSSPVVKPKPITSEQMAADFPEFAEYQKQYDEINKEIEREMATDTRSYDIPKMMVLEERRKDVEDQMNKMKSEEQAKKDSISQSNVEPNKDDKQQVTTQGQKDRREIFNETLRRKREIEEGRRALDYAEGIEDPVQKTLETGAVIEKAILGTDALSDVAYESRRLENALEYGNTEDKILNTGRVLYDIAKDRDTFNKNKPNESLQIPEDKPSAPINISDQISEVGSNETSYSLNEKVPLERATSGNLYAQMYNNALDFSSRTGLENPYAGDSWSAQEMRVKAGIQERNTALDNVSWKNYDHIMKDKSLSTDDKVKAIFGDGNLIPPNIDPVPIQKPLENIGDNLVTASAETEKARISTASISTTEGMTKSFNSGVENIVGSLKESQPKESVVSGGGNISQSGETPPTSDEETRAVSEYVLRYIFGENVNGSEVLSLL